MAASGFLPSTEEQRKVWTQGAHPFWPLIRAAGEAVWAEGPEQSRYVT